jgi:hypothetical protein
VKLNSVSSLSYTIAVPAIRLSCWKNAHYP